jgi:hypothetical protein
MRSAVVIMLAASMLALPAAPLWARGQKDQKQSTEKPQAEVAAATFDPAAVVQTFTKTTAGGVHRVVAAESSDATQIGRIRATLKSVADDFVGHYTGDRRQTQGGGVAGLGTLVAAAPGELHCEYLEVRAGAEVRYSSDSPRLVAALHEWFDAQSADRAAAPAPAPAAAPLISMPH